MRPAPAVKLIPPISSLPRLAVVSLTGTTIEYFAPMGAMMVAPTLGPNQQEGTVVFDVKPPASSSYRDSRSNTNLLVVES